MIIQIENIKIVFTPKLLQYNLSWYQLVAPEGWSGATF